jgi:hypothetical protein
MLVEDAAMTWTKNRHGEGRYICCATCEELDIDFSNECGVYHMSGDVWGEEFTLIDVAFCPFCGKKIPELPDNYHQTQKKRGKTECLGCGEKL